MRTYFSANWHTKWVKFFRNLVNMMWVNMVAWIRSFPASEYFIIGTIQ